MTGTEVAVVEHGSTLALDQAQTYWTPAQLSALQHIGVDKAGPGDLHVFHHVCQRTGLDPFARQIYMIGRKANELDADGNWVKVIKQTIQTGIDGFRLIGRRAANSSGHAVSVCAPEWAHRDGDWRPVWLKEWGTPVAARVTIKRAGEPFTGVALFDEYKQTKQNGDLTQMWSQRGAGQIAKCAEALAWRMAFPQDLSGIYSDDEMGQADQAEAPGRVHVEQASGAERMRAVLQTSGPDAAPTGAYPDLTGGPASEIAHASGPESPLLNTSSALAKAMYAGLRQRNFGDDSERMDYIVETVGRRIESTKEMTDDEARRVLSRLDEENKPSGAPVSPADLSTAVEASRPGAPETPPPVEDGS